MFFCWINSVWGVIESSCLESNMWNGHSNATVLSVVVVIAKRWCFFWEPGVLGLHLTNNNNDLRLVWTSNIFAI